MNELGNAYVTFVALNLDVLRQKINDELFVNSTFEVGWFKVLTLVNLQEKILLIFLIFLKELVYRTSEIDILLAVGAYGDLPASVSAGVSYNDSQKS